jgi:hypothetical protein
MHVIRELLDKQLVDRDEERIGRIDGILAEVSEGSPPRITELELGFVTIASRIGPRFQRFAEALHRRWSVRRSMRYHIPWTLVKDVKAHHVQVDVCVEDTAAFDWERWLRNNVIGKIPGASSEE